MRKTFAVAVTVFLSLSLSAYAEESKLGDLGKKAAGGATAGAGGGPQGRACNRYPWRLAPFFYLTNKAHHDQTRHFRIVADESQTVADPEVRSALDQKQTSAVQQPMSALGQKRAFAQSTANVESLPTSAVRRHHLPIDETAG